MPTDNSIGVDPEQYQKDKDELAATVDDVLAMDEAGKTDEEIIKELDEKQGKKDGTDVASGDATKDPDKPETPADKPDTDSIDDLIAADQSGVDDDTAKIPDTDAAGSSDGDSWQQKAEAAEAELKKERQKTASWAGRITAANNQVKELKAEVQVLTEANAAEPDPDSKSNPDVLEGFKDDFPELSEAFGVLQKQIKALQTANTPDKVVADVDASPDVDDPAVQPSTHLEEVKKVHSDLDEMVNSGVLKTWINRQADYLRPHLDQIYTKGNVKQVVDMIKRFKDDSGWKSQLDKIGDSKEQTQQEKLDALKVVDSEGGGPPAGAPDKNDYDGAAKEAFG